MLKIGDTYNEILRFNRGDMITFLDIVGDSTPMHRDVDSPDVKNSKEQKITVQGMYAVSMFSGPLSRNFPGTGSINIYREVTFVRPVYIDEPYTMSFKVVDIDREQHIGTIKCWIKNNRNKTCIDCTTRLKNELQF